MMKLAKDAFQDNKKKKNATLEVKEEEKPVSAEPVKMEAEIKPPTDKLLTSNVPEKNMTMEQAKTFVDAIIKSGQKWTDTEFLPN